MQKLGVSQQGHVHQSRVGRIEDRSVFSPSRSAKQPQYHTDDYKHERHADQDSDHSWIQGPRRLLHWFHRRADDRAIHRDLGHHLELASTSFVPAFCLEVHVLALFVKHACFVDAGRFPTLVLVVADWHVWVAVACLLNVVAYRVRKVTVLDCGAQVTVQTPS